MTEQDQPKKMILNHFINNGELGHMDRERAFLVGVEWGFIAQVLMRGEGFQLTIMPENRHRVTAGAEQLGYAVITKLLPDNWVHVEAQPRHIELENQDA